MKRNNNNNYWEKFGIESKKKQIKSEMYYFQYLDTIYNSINSRLEAEIAKTFLKYGTNNNISPEEAKRVITGADEKDIKEKIKAFLGGTNKGNKENFSFMISQSLKKKHTIQEKLRIDVKSIIDEIKLDYMNERYLKNAFKNSSYELQHMLNEPRNEHRVKADRIKNVIEEPFLGERFSDRIWQDKEKLKTELDKVLIDGILTGIGYEKMSRDLSKRLDVSKSNAKRIISTEYARLDSIAKLDEYRRYGVKNVQIIATLDNRTSNICLHKNLKIVPIEEAEIGLNIPPFHPYCRSVIIPYIDEKETQETEETDETEEIENERKETYQNFLERIDKENAKELLANYGNFKIVKTEEKAEDEKTRAKDNKEKETEEKNKGAYSKLNADLLLLSILETLPPYKKKSIEFKTNRPIIDDEEEEEIEMEDYMVINTNNVEKDGTDYKIIQKSALQLKNNDIVLLKGSRYKVIRQKNEDGTEKIILKEL